MSKLVYDFSEGSTEMKELLGGKGANLSEMTGIGLPVPPGFVITTDACLEYFENNSQLTEEMKQQIFENIEALEEKTGKKLGNKENPLLISVRSGAVVSMPGMMDTVLNIGLNDETVEGLARRTGNPRFAYDSYRRLLQMFGEVVLSISAHKFDRYYENIKEKYEAEEDTDLTAENIQEIITEFKDIIARESGSPFPQDPQKQILEAVRAVFDSWNNERAKSYRRLNNIPHDLGTAVTVQTMVFGNIGENSATGVAFTRNPSTGENKVYGEFLPNAQGEDVVAGIRTPKDIEELNELMPEAYQEFMEIVDRLEEHYRDMQDIEFTIEEGQVYILQTRTGKRTAKASVKIATDMFEEGLIDRQAALMRVDPEQLEQLLHPSFDAEEVDEAEEITTGLAASPGAATGKVYFTSNEAVKATERGEKVILVRAETSPEDIEGMAAAEGILTSRGGMTSHAAVVARGMGKCCVAGAGEVIVEEENKRFSIGDKVYTQGDIISLNGSTGKVYEGSIKTMATQLSDDFLQLLDWADKERELGVMANADTPEDAKAALEFGAEGIGLCRTEHMFFEQDRISAVREMIIARNKQEREKALDKLFPHQKDDFCDIFTVMEGKKVVIRLLDPPLHEFLPEGEEEIKDIASTLDVKVDTIKENISELEEVNPMLGHRGCRLGISYPEIYEMQIRAIISAALKVKEEKNLEVKPFIMIPLVGIPRELTWLRERAEDVIEEELKSANTEIQYSIGTMIEVPRAAMAADKIAREADFFSFGTNDLSQLTFGFSRDDAGKFLKEYEEKGILDRDPFIELDKNGVGEIMKIAVKSGRKVDPDLELGICGEHGGNPPSVEYCHNLNLDYVSCSPFRLPIARVAAAQSAIKEKNEEE